MNPIQFRMARAVLRQSVEIVASKAKVSPANLRRLELNQPVSDQIRNRVQAMYEDLGMTFHENEAGDFSGSAKPFNLSFVEDPSMDPQPAMINYQTFDESRVIFPGKYTGYGYRCSQNPEMDFSICFREPFLI